MKPKIRLGVTLIELLVALICFSLILLPAYHAFLMGTRTSLTGMLQVGTTMEARLALRQIHADLKGACLPFDARDLKITLDQLLSTSILGGETVYALQVFPRHVEPTRTIVTEPNGLRPHVANRVTYSLETVKSGDPRKRLVRREKPHAGTGEAPRVTILSERVNHFEIRTVSFRGPVPRSAFFVTLQLIDSLDAAALSNLPTDPVGRPRGVVLADYCDLVVPTFLSSMMAQEGVNRTWYSELRGPP
ncbi:MAG TPA: prepilin-type N-terminal cleavage/methylation domain-containing protein [Candidatus Ozemobacteraceae bacterium]|nr:prepilin-type N-terminal cleavage/methylation domain-containing protein [Candidatus Ozemobacteraceae bacterium]